MGSEACEHRWPQPHRTSPAARVLLVDECREDLHYYSVILQAYGFQVRTCRSYEQGTRFLNSETFDFVVVTQGTSNFEGRCVLERANQIDRCLPVLVLARWLDMPCYLEAMQLGAVDYLVEPVTVQELGHVVETHIRPRAATREGRNDQGLAKKRDGGYQGKSTHPLS